MGAATVRNPRDRFADAINSTKQLRLKPGLQAIKRGEGHGFISGKDPKCLLGSVAIDDDCPAHRSNENRWDYVIGYDRSNQAIAHFVEVHSAETSQVRKMRQKLQWLRDFLVEPPQAKLAALPREYHWVASGRFNIPKDTPQYRMLQVTMRKEGLKGPVSRLVLT